LRRRALANPAPVQGGEYRIEKDPISGLPVMVAPAEVTPVSSEEIRALMTDFP